MISINPASFDDIAIIRALALEIWPITYKNILNSGQIDYMLNLMYSTEALQEQMKKNHQFLLAEKQGVFVAFAAYSLIKEKRFQLHKLYLLPNQQGLGTGRLMMRWIIEALTKKEATSLRLNVNRNNSARIFYEKLGFTIIASEDNNIGQGYFMNDYVMEKKLNEE
ncbi:MAG: GNAT family N-acetyltransferase [Flavisolibacter sp.]